MFICIKSIIVLCKKKKENKLILFYSTSGFWPRVRARALRAPVFGGIATPNGRCAPPPIAASLLHVHRPKNVLFPETKASFRPELGPPGSNIPRPSSHLSHPTELCCILRTMLHPTELCCTLLSYAASSWATMHPNKLHCIQYILLHNTEYY